jgi:hypothetical protein
MITIRRKAALLSVVPVAAACIAVAAAGAPAGALAKTPGGVTPPGGPTPSYYVTVFSNISVSGDTVAGSNGYSPQWSPPQCWLQPYFEADQSYQTGDPVTADPPSGARDADSYWFSVAALYPGMLDFLAHVGGPSGNGVQEVNQDFEAVQHGTNGPGGGAVGKNWVWWAPNWLEGSAGEACAKGLISSLDMNNGFLDLEPPQAPGQGGNATGEINDEILRKLARAALRLPVVDVNTRPNGQDNANSAYVNAPMVVYVKYLNPDDLPRQVEQTPTPTDTGTVTFEGRPYLSVTINTKLTGVSITTNDPGATIVDNNHCTAQNGPGACKVTFNTPTGTEPYVVTVTVTWDVTWTSTDGNGGAFPPAQVSGTATDIVREIQSVNGN